MEFNAKQYGTVPVSLTPADRDSYTYGGVPQTGPKQN